MSTVLEVLTVAYRRAGILPTGRQLVSVDIATGIEYLRSCYGSWVTGGMFGKLAPIRKEDAGPVTAEERQWISHKTADVITLPLTVVDQGVTRSPFNGAPIVLTNSETGVTTKYIYDMTKAEWLTIEDLDIGDYCPLTGSYDMSIKTMFAVYLADECGVQISGPLAKQYAAHKMTFVGRWAQPRNRDVGSFF